MQKKTQFAITPILRGNTVFVAGIDWVPVPLRAFKKPKAQARRRGATHVVSYRYRDREKNLKVLLGMMNWRALHLPKSVKEGFALSLLIVQKLKTSGFVIIGIDEKSSLFVSFLEGVLTNDVVGDRHTIEKMQKNFLQLNSEPETGWQIFAPEDWQIPNSAPFDLDAFIRKGGFPASARFKTTSRRGVFLGITALLILLATVHWGFRSYQAQKAALHQAEIRKTLLAQQQAQSTSTTPWQEMPRVKAFIQRCGAQWQALPLSLAGWRFTEAQCSQDGTIRFAYTRVPGATVGDFAERVKQHFPKSQPYFNLPQEGDIGGFSQPVKFQMVKDTRALPDRDSQIQRLTTFAQRMRLNLNLQEPEASNEALTSTWQRFPFTLETPITPILLFDALDDVGLRLQSLTIRLSQGRLLYRIEGALYAND